MTHLRRLGRRLRREEGGFTLIEVLVAASVGLVVAGATLAILDVSQHLSSRISDRVESERAGRVAMGKIVQELHSSCVAALVTPVQPLSSSTTLIFLSQYGGQTVLTPIKHSITYTSGTALTSNLTDQQFISNGGTAPAWTFPAAPTSTVRLASNVTQSNVTGSTPPVFQYYAYTAAGQLSTTALPVPLSVTDAQSVAQVAINFAVGPLRPGGPQLDRVVNQTDSVVLRLSPASGSAASNAPCA